MPTPTTCSEAKTYTESDIQSASFASSSAPVQISEQTDAASASLSITRGKPTANLTAYPSGYTGELLLKVSAKTDGSSNSPPVSVGSNFQVYTSIDGAVDGGATWIGDYIGDINPSFTIATCVSPAVTKGWEVADQALVLTRSLQYFATDGFSGTPRMDVILPDEYFQLDADQTLSGETTLVWGMVKLTSSGGASRSYPAPSATGAAVDFGPSSTLLFDRAAPGFDPSRFLNGPYRPVILITLRPSFSGTASSVQFKLYVNGNFVRSITASAGQKPAWLFSIYGVGNFSNIRPPDNNSSDDYNGWSSPSIYITATAVGGTAVMAQGTKLTDYVLNYPV